MIKKNCWIASIGGTKILLSKKEYQGVRKILKLKNPPERIIIRDTFYNTSELTSIMKVETYLEQNFLRRVYEKSTVSDNSQVD